MSSRTAAEQAQEVGRPWPYRAEGDPLPTFCPKCGRRLLPYAWGSGEPYLELACAGRLQGVARFVLRGVLLSLGHYNFTVGTGLWSQYDPVTGERQRMPFRFR